MRGGQVARVGLFHDDHALVLPQFPSELAPAYVHGKNFCRAVLEQAVGESAGGSAEVERDQSFHVELKMIQRVFQLVTAAQFPQPFAPADLAVIDCSFISLRKILPAAVPLLKADGKIVALIKPQFEAGKAEADKGRGVITDAAIHDRVIRELQDFVSAQAGIRWRDVVESPLLGPAGNKEFLVLIEKDLC